VGRKWYTYREARATTRAVSEPVENNGLENGCFFVRGGVGQNTELKINRNETKNDAI
jgi:hypothetical protein